MSTPRAIVASYVGVVLFASVIFIAAGRMSYWQGLLYLTLALTGTTLNHVLEKPGSNITLHRANEALQGETWDKRLLGIHFVISLRCCTKAERVLLGHRPNRGRARPSRV